MASGTNYCRKDVRTSSSRSMDPGLGRRHFSYDNMVKRRSTQQLYKTQTNSNQSQKSTSTSQCSVATGMDLYCQWQTGSEIMVARSQVKLPTHMLQSY
ncbi:hypothetical protein AVEN_143216-1 [Araneus ventricosus]|uniref:Uncharacterized protein n=1 Tax=Araneus ventricosus TaxID=182803 RepID=A0A4Y2AEX6_ARAVE|nr:hypothetical protein AVEN_143216-1 [Araneus ventricosus]